MAERIPNIERCCYGERCDRDRIHVPLYEIDLGREQEAAFSGHKMPLPILCEKHMAEHAEAKRSEAARRDAVRT